jgi:hypothetical protein
MISQGNNIVLCGTSIYIENDKNPLIYDKNNKSLIDPNMDYDHPLFNDTDCFDKNYLSKLKIWSSSML